MCTETITLSKNKNGYLAHCSTCEMYRLYFNNIYLEFSEVEFESFKRYISEIDPSLWYSCTDRATQQRNIPIPTMQSNLVLTFNQEELDSLRDIVFELTSRPNTPIGPSEIDYLLILN